MLCHALVALQTPELAGPSPLVPRYVESSSGLSFPDWDGGNTEIEFGDVDRDGNLDMVSVGDHGSPFIGTNMHGIVVWFGDGAGGWSAVQSGDFGYGGCALGDVNGDGWLDVGYGVHHNYASGDLGDQLIEVALGDGSGQSWIPWDDGLATSGETYGMFDCDFGDVDADGDLDLACLSFGCCNGWRLYLNNGDGTWTPRYSVSGGNTRPGIVFGDVNNDGHLDLAVGHEAGTVWLGDGGGGFAPGDRNLPPGSALGRSGVDLGDANNDGRADLVYVSSGGLKLWLQAPGGSWVQAGTGLPASGSFERADLADMNRDDRLDLVAFGEGEGAVFLGDGHGGFRRAAGFQTAQPGYAAALRAGGDVDHNGMPDIAVVADEGTIFSSRNRLRFFREVSEPAVPAILVTSPGPAAALRRGSLRFVDWLSAVPGGAPADVDLELSVSGISGPWTPIASGLADSGRLAWLVAGAASSDCRIRATLRTTAGTVRRVSGRFTIL
ncbi:MAG: VCBS repeat-containing protein [Planctomycetota bacterium]|nr:MAG: VCBS repeat-containing protein [Planctomycetota bacterium]